MDRAYSRLLTNFSLYNDGIKSRVVTNGYLLKIIFLIELFFLKLFFLVFSFPFFLFASPRDISKKDTINATTRPQRFQQVLVLSFVGLVILIFAFRALSSSLIQSQVVDDTSVAPLQLSGTRPYLENTPLSIQKIDVSPFDHSVTFTGMGPAYSHVELFVDNGETLVGTALVDIQGEWQYTENPAGVLFSPGSHSVFAVFYGDDNTLLGQPTAVQTFKIPADALWLGLVFRYFSFNSVVIALISLGIFIMAIVTLKKTVKV